MKKSLLLISACILWFALLEANSQNYRNRQVALISYTCNIHQTVKSQLDGYAHLFPELEHRRADRLVGAITERTWYMIKDSLESGTGMYILPINTYGRSFRYDEYNFPDMNINRALRAGSSRFYLRIEMIVSSALSRPEGGYGSRFSRDPAETVDFDLTNAILPEVTLNVTVYSDRGVIPVQRVTGKATAEAPLLLGEELFNGIHNRERTTDKGDTTLLGLITVALSDLIKNF